MKILMFGWNYSTKLSGGLGTACKGLTEALDYLGEEVVFIYPSDEPSFDGNHSKVSPVVELNRRLKNLQLFKVPWLFYPYAPYQDEPLNYQIEDSTQYLGLKHITDATSLLKNFSLEKIRDNAFDIIHVHDWPAFSSAFAAKAQLNIPVVLHVHSTALDRQGKNANELILNIEKKAFKLADAIIAVSHQTKGILIENYDISPTKIHVIHPGTSREKFRVSNSNTTVFSNKSVIGFLGRFTSQKQPLRFVNIASRLLNMDSNYSFIMAGDGVLRPATVELVADMGLSKYFYFPGHIENEERTAFFDHLDLLLVPSSAEPFGLVALEAALANTPVIMDKNAGANEVLTANFKLDMGEINDVAIYIHNLLQSGHGLQHATKSNYSIANVTNWEKSANEVVELYQKVLNQFT